MSLLSENTSETIVDAMNVVPVLPLRDVVVYPHMVIPLFVGREKSIRALDTAMQNNKQILLVAQKSAETDDPGIEDMHGIGTLASILQLLKLPDGTEMPVRLTAVFQKEENGWKIVQWHFSAGISNEDLVGETLTTQ